MPDHFVVQAFKRKGRKLVPDQPLKVRDAESAVEKAQRYAGSCVGIVAYVINVDPEVDYWGDPRILYKRGELPPDFEDF